MHVQNLKLRKDRAEHVKRGRFKPKQMDGIETGSVLYIGTDVEKGSGGYIGTGVDTGVDTGLCGYIGIGVDIDMGVDIGAWAGAVAAICLLSLDWNLGSMSVWNGV